MSDDLIERLEKGVRRPDRKPADNTQAERELAKEAAARIRALEYENTYLREIADAAARTRDEALEALETAGADALEKAARVLARSAEEIRALKPKAKA
jgi:hypothetical protein